MADDEINVKGLDKLLKALKGKMPVARVGILGDGGRSDGGKSNATIGAAHEYGTPRLPQRSFLRIPISDNLGKRLQNAQAFDEDVLKEVIASGTVVPWLEKVAVLAESIVLEAFDTGGFGKWPALKPATIARKHNNQILVETNQLRDSISSDVVA